MNIILQDLENIATIKEKSNLKSNNGHQCFVDKVSSEDFKIKYRVPVIKFSEDCKLFCSNCKDNEISVRRDQSRLSVQEIITEIINISKLGFKKIILSGCQQISFDADLISHIIYSVKTKIDIDIGIVLSLGLRDFNDYKKWKISGASGYLLFHDSDENDYKSVENFKTTKLLKSLGYSINIGLRWNNGLSLAKFKNEVEKNPFLEPDFFIFNNLQDI